MREVFFHEDDYCQQELLPAAALDWCSRELGEIDRFSEAHRAADGAGWTDLYVRPNAPAELLALRITREEVAAALGPLLPEFDRVLTGYSSFREECRNSSAWGTGEGCEFFASWNAEGFVSAIWTNLFDSRAESLAKAASAVEALGTLRPLIYVDWAWGYTARTAADVFVPPLRTKTEDIARRWEETIARHSHEKQSY